MNDAVDAVGYRSRAYAASLCLGDLVHLPACDGYLIARETPTVADAFDLMGPYPLFACQEWSRIGEDLERLPEDYAAAYLVSDPFADVRVETLAGAGWDYFAAFKEHYVVDLTSNAGGCVSKHHLRKVRQAARACEVQRVENPLALLDEWNLLYANLVRRHSVSGVARFSHESFKLQLALPGMTALVVYVGETPVGMTLWLTDRNVTYYHLGAYSELGYHVSASYALFGAALNEFQNQVEYLALGGAAGSQRSSADGLARFKRGWSTGTRTVYMCGRVLNKSLYASLAKRSCESASESTYFPAYRAPTIAPA